MKTQLNKILIATSIALTLSACGGGGSESTTPTTPTAGTPTPTPTPTVSTQSVSGNVIDGYVVGATIWADYNFNGVLDDGEPSAVSVEPTADNPGWTLDVEEACVGFVPIITHVPVGAIDLDFPDTPIEEEYTMVQAPLMEENVTTNSTLLNVTPLTTMIWTAVEQEIKINEDLEPSCKSLLANMQMREQIKDRLTQQEIRIAERYNITVDDLYGDYVANGNTKLHGLARDLVTGLQASYKETRELEQSNPDGVAFVEYYIGAGNPFGDYSWSRREYTNHNGRIVDVTTNAGSAPRKGGSIYIARNSNEYNSNGLTVTERQTYEEGFCTKSEQFSYVNGSQQYSVTNTALSSEDYGWGGCQGLNIVDNFKSQAFEVISGVGSNSKVETEIQYIAGLEEEEGNVDSFINFSIVGVGASALSGDWIVGNSSFIDNSFMSTESHGSSFWSRSKSDTFESGNIRQVLETRSSDGRHVKSTYYFDGTKKQECGYITGGGFSDCTGNVPGYYGN